MCFWECLPEYILDKILNQFDLLSDFIRFGVVCKTWHVVFLQRKRHRIEQCKNEVPFLYISTCYKYIDPPTKSSNDNYIENLPTRLFDMFENKSYNSMSPGIRSMDLSDFNCSVVQLFSMLKAQWYDFMSPVIPPRSSYNIYQRSRTLGSSYGWLATIIEKGKHSIIILNNPMTGNTISLPPLPNRRSASYISTVVLSCNPSIYPDKCVVAYSSLCSIGFIWIGGTKWTKSTAITRVMIEAILFHKGRLYALNRAGDLFVIDYHLESYHGDKCSFRRCYIDGNSDFQYCETRYLVESGRGELLMINTGRMNYSSYTNVVMVFKLVITHDNGNETMMGHWVRIHRLGDGDEVLFLGDCHNVICSKSTNLQTNSVYICNPQNNIDSPDRYYLMRVFALNKEMEQGENNIPYLSSETWLSVFDLLPVWINPTLQ